MSTVTWPWAERLGALLWWQLILWQVAVVQHCIDQRACQVAWRGVHNHASRLRRTPTSLGATLAGVHRRQIPSLTIAPRLLEYSYSVHLVDDQQVLVLKHNVKRNVL